ncbi:sarcosine oxidase subunit gamma [Rhizobium sp. CRIBSB]|nr:sarcosine oxidase subunit gamma [Rhizobium sp. CRIBSB]
MSDLIHAPMNIVQAPLLRRHVVVSVAEGAFAGLSIELVAQGSILQLMARPGSVSEAEILAVIQEVLGSSKGWDLRVFGPGQWFLLCEAIDIADLLQQKFGAGVSVVDQSHGRCRIRISGSAVLELLPKGTGVDLDIREFPIGRTAATLFGHHGVVLTRIGPESFEVLVLRSLAESLMDEFRLLAAGTG